MFVALHLPLSVSSPSSVSVVAVLATCSNRSCCSFVGFIRCLSQMPRYFVTYNWRSACHSHCQYLVDECVNENLPNDFWNWSLSMLITLDWTVSEGDGRLFANPNKTSARWFDLYSFWKLYRAASDWFHIQTTKVFLFSCELTISIPCSCNLLVRLSVWGDLALVLLRRSSITWWSSFVSMKLYSLHYDFELRLLLRLEEKKLYCM